MAAHLILRGVASVTPRQVSTPQALPRFMSGSCEMKMEERRGKMPKISGDHIHA